MGKRGASVNPPAPDPNGPEDAAADGAPSAKVPVQGGQPSRAPQQQSVPSTTPAPRFKPAQPAASSHAPKRPSRAPLPGAKSTKPPPASPMPMMKAGRIVGRYRLLVPIGAGGMAQVWAARPESAGLARVVAIKLVLPDYAADGEYERMFVDEAMVASAIRHQNVCETLELGRDGDLLFMVLEWIAGE